LQPFLPLVRHPHLLTILAHFWPHGLDERRWPAACDFYNTAPGIRVLVKSHRPASPPRGHLVLVHGLEGSSDAVYMKSTARAALTAGFAAHRMNLRGCGGTEEHCPTAYHSGLTSDVRAVVEELAQGGGGPVFLAGYSLGGNVVLKLAGELGENARGLIAGVAAMSTPIDLDASTSRLEQRQNRVYERRFLRKLKQRVRVHADLSPEFFGSLDGLEAVRSIREFDNRFTSRWFGFRDAADYYFTQSAIRVLDRIRIPTLLLQAKDDPVVPFETFTGPEVAANPCIELLAPEHGGHLGFIARRPPRWWADAALMEWIGGRPISGVSSLHGPAPGR
jgi:predicted alpha/beta-fold hydrolase